MRSRPGRGNKQSFGRRAAIVALAVATVAPGCAATRRYVDKPWGKGTWIPALVCGAAGAGAGVGIQEARRGENTVITPTGTEVQRDDANYWQGALVGAAIGAVVCALAGHYFFDAEVETPAPPPPPPAPIPTPPTTLSRRIVLRGITFDFNQSTIRPDARPVLDEAVEVLKENPSVAVAVEGYTDAIGSDAYNQSLSLRRAEAVFRYLVNSGIAPDRLTVEGFGESNPVATNDTEAGRAQNRRVELRVK